MPEACLLKKLSLSAVKVLSFTKANFSIYIQMKKEIEEHDRKEWGKNSKGAIEYSVYYTPELEEKERKEIEAKIRATYIPTYGKS